MEAIKHRITYHQLLLQLLEQRAKDADEKPDQLIPASEVMACFKAKWL